MTRMNRIGLLGCGLLGSALAERFRGAGFDVLGYDAEPARSLGARSAAQVAAECRRVVLCLPHSGIVHGVLDEIGSRLSRDSILIDTTTGSPESSASLGARYRYVDATVGGSSRLVRERKAIVIAGGDDALFAESRDLFDTFADRVFHVGPAGHGARMKLAMNLVLGLNRAALAEGLAFAEVYGLDPAVTLEVFKAGPSFSAAMDAKGARMLERNYAPDARLKQHHKDVRLILEAGKACGAKLPLSTLHDRLLGEAEQMGLGDQDNCAIVEWFRSR